MRHYAAACLSVVLFSGCATIINPLIRDFNIVPVEQERRIGEEMETQIAAQMPLLQGTAMNARVEKIGQTLAQALPNIEFRYEFFVVQDDTLNAFAIPGGAIYVHTGLLKAANDDELAGVIAHEIGHVYERHPAKAMSRIHGFNYLATLVLPENAGQVQKLALQFAQGGVLNKYGRDDEREADEIAFYLIKETPFSTQGLISFLKKMQRLQGGGGSLPVFLSTHPPTPERIERLEKLQQGQIQVEQPS